MKKFHEVIQDEAGNIVVGAEVYIRANTTPFALATIYSDDGSTTTANPMVSGSDGYVTSWFANGTYKIEVYVDGELEKTITDYQHFDLDNTFIASLLDDADAATARTTLGVGTGDSPQFTAINLGHASDTTLTRTGAGDIAVEGNAVYRAGGTDVPVADGGTGASTAAGARTNLGLGTSAVFDEATAAQFRNNTADKVLTTDVVWAAAAGVALAESGGNVAVDLNSGINFTLAMTGNWALSNPTNGKAFQQGVIQITQDATGSRTLSYGANWKFAGGTDPVLSTAANAIDLLYYEVLADGSSVYANLVKAIA